MLTTGSETVGETDLVQRDTFAESRRIAECLNPFALVAALSADEPVRERGVRRRRIDLANVATLFDRLLHTAREVEHPGRVAADCHRTWIQLTRDVAVYHRFVELANRAEMHRVVHPQHRSARVQLDCSRELGSSFLEIEAIPVVVQTYR